MSLQERTVDELPRLVAWREKGKIVRVLDEVEIFYIASPNFGLNRNSKPPLLVIHGYPISSFDFWKMHNGLLVTFDVFLWDMAGYGFSEKVHRTIPQQVDILEALLEQLGYTDMKLHVLAHDLGDSVLQEMLARQVLDNKRNVPYFVESVAMLNGGILPSFHRPTVMQHLMTVPCLNTMLAHFFTVSLAKKSISKVFGPQTKPTDEEIVEYYALVNCNDGKKLLTENIKYMQERQIHAERWVSALQQYAQFCPVCLIDGPVDPVSGRHLGEAVQSQVQGCRVVFLDDAIGHWPQIEAPDATLKAVLDCFHNTRNN